MQQHNQIVYVKNQSRENLYYGQCLIEQLTKNQFEVPLPVYFEYNKEEGICIINHTSFKPLFHLMHAASCPCLNKKFESINPKQISFAVVSIIQDSENNFLLTKRNAQMRSFPQAWVFPGGMVDKGCDLEMEVLRELQEEVGIQVQQVDTCKPLVLFESCYPTISDDYPKKQTLVLFYVVTTKLHKDEIILTLCKEEVDDYVWISEEDMIQIAQFQGQKYPHLMGVYPNELGQGIGGGHLLALQYMFKMNQN